MELALELRDEMRAVMADQMDWPALLTRLAKRLGAADATFGGGERWSAPVIHSPCTDPGYHGAYVETYHQQNDFMQTMMSRSLGRVGSAADLPEFRTFQASDFYNLWCRPQGFLHMYGFTVTGAGGWWGTMAINTAREPSAENIASLSALIPHIQRIVETQLLLAQLRSSNSATLSVLNMTGHAGMLLDRHGRVLEVNGLAEAMLLGGRLHLRDGRLADPKGSGEQGLAQLISQCLERPDHAGGRLLLGDGISVQCAPFPGSIAFPAPQRPAVIVVIDDPEQRLRARLGELQRHHGLTHAEAELALAVLQTGSRKAAADRRGVTDATARAQLSSIFDKTGVRRQTELVRLLLDEN